MKNLKSIILAAFCLLTVGNAFAGNDKPITVNQLPKAAKTFINTFYKGEKIALAKMETGILEKSYDVIFANGDKVEFSRNGAWTEVDCKRGGKVPSKIVPSQITNYVNKNYKGQTIRHIEKERSNFEIEISNGLEFKFDSKFRLIDIDD